MKGLATAAISLVLAAACAWAGDGDLVGDHRDEVNRRFTLPDRARVHVSAINGSVDIRAIDGDTAIVQIERAAHSRAELDCNRVVVKQASGHLTVRSEGVGGQGCQTIQVRHRLVLSLPRGVDVSIQGVSGPIKIGAIEGALHISGNSGSIHLEQSGMGSSITGNHGATTIDVRRPDAGGLVLSGNNGDLKLCIADEVDVDVRVTGLEGEVSSELPDVTVSRTGAADYRARIGSGGPRIRVERNTGSVLLVRYRE